MQKILPQNIWRKAMLPVVAALAIGVATPVLAADYFVPAPRAAVVAPAGPLTLQDALAAASNIGVVTVEDTHFTGERMGDQGP